jgi:sulfide dehydrogenase cytochrome subunit
MAIRKLFVTGTALALWVAVVPSTAIGASSDSDFTAQCQVCHGPDGVSRWPDVPNISGLPTVVIANALYDFRGRARPCRTGECGPHETCPDADMCYLSHELDDEQIERYAAWYSAQPFSPSAPDIEVNAELVRVGSEIHAQRCESCHTGGGSRPLDEASILRGQNTAYLRNALADYREGRRVQEAGMAEAIASLNDGDIEALLHFYAAPTR